MKEWMRVSVVIPTKNRPDFLLRSVYWYGSNSIPLFIGDSSAGFLKSLQDVPDRIKQWVRYQHYIDNANEIEASWKIAQVVTTPYVAWAGDDDFLISHFLKAAVQILDRQPRATSVAGHVVIFRIKHDRVWGELESVMSYPYDAFFRVYRRGLIIEAWEEVKDLKDPSLSHAERASLRGRALFEVLEKTDNHRVRVPLLAVLRQVHPSRLTAEVGEPWRARLGHFLPEIQYAKQWLESWWKPLSLPALRRESSPHFLDFEDVERFLARLETRMFSNAAATGYHRFRLGCCSLEKADPIHDPEILRQLETGEFWHDK